MSQIKDKLRVSLGLSSLADIFPGLEDRLMKPVRRQQTGWPRLDLFMVGEGVGRGGLVRPSLVVLGAEPKIGKSIWSQTLCETMVDAGGYALYIDLENGKERFLRRLMYRRADILEGDLSRGLSKVQKARVEEVRDWFLGPVGSRFLVEESVDRNPEAFKTRITTMRKIIGPSAPLLVVVDSLQKLPVSLSKDRRAGIDTWIRVMEKTRELADCVILIISELKRPPQGKGKYKPDGTSFKESGDIEYTADLSLAMTRVGDRSRHMIKLEAIFNRDGPIGPIARYELMIPSYRIEETKLETIDKD